MSQLSQKTIDIVRSTAPVLREHGVVIVATMYRNMFRDDPEVKPYFNQAHQSTGTGTGTGTGAGAGAETTRASQVESSGDHGSSTAPAAGSQANALANVILAFATNVDKLAALTPTVLRIANKHASLNILPEHYPIVGKHLLGAIREVLGDGATEDVIGAWQEAYGFLAELFIGLENGLREEGARKVGGWQGFRKCVVTRKVRETDEVQSFYLKPQDGEPLPPYQAGQYTCFRLDIPGRGLVYRTYTLSTAPGKGHFRVSIKRERGARGQLDGAGSNHFHDHVNEGDVLDVAPPYGDFTLADSALPCVFIAAGIGITPMFSMLQSAASAGLPRKIHFVQCMRNGRLHALKDEVRELARSSADITLHTWYSQPESTDRQGTDYDVAGRLDLELLRTLLPVKESEFYFTGPVGFMREVRSALRGWGVPAERIHYECFGPMAAGIEEARPDPG